MKQKKKILLIVSAILLVAIVVTSIYVFAVVIPNKKEEERKQQMVKEYYQNKLNLYKQENEEYDDYEVDVAFLGDSLTDGYDLKKYYPEYLTSNRGIGGETTIGLEKRLDVSVYDLKPKVVVMLIGGNNLYNMFDNYEDILIGLKENLPDSKVVLLSLTAMGRDWGHKNEIACLNNVKIKLLAQKYNFEFVDLFTPLFDLSVNELYKEYSNDGAHFTHLGYEVVTSKITPVLEELLGR